MSSLLYIPWFKLHAWEIPFPIFGEIAIQPFGILVATGILFGSRVAEWRGERTGVPPQAVADFLLNTILIGFICAMVLNVVFYTPERIMETIRDPSTFQYPGLSSFGGFLGGTGAAVWFRQRKRASVFVLGDIFCFAFPFAWLFGRTGCFVVHDHPGKVTEFFLAVDNYNLGGLPRHDLGLYEVIWSATMVALVLWLGSSPRPRGFFMAVVPLCYAPIRFCLDFLRETPDFGGDARYFGLTPGQYGSMLMFAAGVAVAIRIKRGPEPSLNVDGGDHLPDFAPVAQPAAASPEPQATKSDKPAAGRPHKPKKKKKRK